MARVILRLPEADSRPALCSSCGRGTCVAPHHSCLASPAQYLRIIRSLPYGNSIFFTVKVCWLEGSVGSAHAV